MAAIRAPMSKTTDKPSAISPATKIGEWFRNSANIGFASKPAIGRSRVARVALPQKRKMVPGTA
jgi:hypothetical protein